MKNSKKDITMRNPEIQLELPNLNTYKFIIADNETDFYNDAYNKKESRGPFNLKPPSTEA